MKKISKLNSLLKFFTVRKGELLNELVNLDASKSCQGTDVPTKVVKENADIFTDFFDPVINCLSTKMSFQLFYSSQM